MKGGVLTELLGITLGISLLTMFSAVIISILDLGFRNYMQLAVDNITYLFGSNFATIFVIALIIAILVSLARWIMSFISFSGQKPNT